MIEVIIFAIDPGIQRKIGNYRENNRLKDKTMPYLPPDYPCYYQNSAGQVINLASVCKGQSSITIEAQKVVTVTLAQYDQVKKGMTYDQVAQIFKAPGFKFYDHKETQGFRSTKYSWTNFDQSRAFIDFSDGIVVSKLQTDLK